VQIRYLFAMPHDKTPLILINLSLPVWIFYGSIVAIMLIQLDSYEKLPH